MSHNVKLGRPTKVLVGLATVWVALYPILLFVAFGLAFSQLAGFAGISTPPLEGFSRFIVSFMFGAPEVGFPGVSNPPVVGITALLCFVLIVFYVSHISRNTGISTAARVIWGIGIIFLPIIAMPAYYYYFVTFQDSDVSQR